MTAGDPQKPPLVLLHGTGGTKNVSQCRRDKLITTLSSDFHVYYPLHPGFSKSELPPKPWTTNDYASYISSFIGSLNIENPVVVGQSFGGRIALDYAVRNQNKIRLLVLGDAAVRLDTPLKYQTALVDIGTPVMNFVFTNKWVPRIIKSTLSQVILGIPDEAINDYADLEVMVETIEKYKETIFEADTLKQVIIPTVIIWGNKDHQFPLMLAQRLAELLPQSELFVFDSGHTAMYDDALKTREIILNRLK